MAVETTIQGKNVLVFQNNGSLNFEFTDGHSAPESSPTLIETGTTPWYTVALRGDGGFAVQWDSAVNASPTEQNYDSNGNPIGGPTTVSSMTDSASFAATSLEQPMVTTNSQANTTTWTAQLPNDDTVAVTFLPNGQSGGAPELEVQQFDQKGNQVGPSNYQTYQGLPGVGDTQIAALPGGGYVVTVTDNPDFGGDISFELFGPNNNLIKATQAVASTGGNGHIGGNALAALPDGGFVMAWIAPQTSTNSGQPSPAAVFTQEFNASGAAATQPHMLGLSGAGTPQITVANDGSYSIAYNANTGTSQVVLFTENGAGVDAARHISTVYTPAPSYTAPVGVFNVNLVGLTAQTVSAGIDAGVHITSNDTASTLIGGASFDTLTAGHNANILIGGSGNDDFIFPYLPWNAGHVTNFTSGHDQIDVSGVLASQGYSGSDPFGDHTLTLKSDGHGGTDLIYNPPGAGSNGIWPILITDIDNVAPSSLNTHNDFYTGYNPPQQGTGTLSKPAGFDGSNGYFLGGQLAIDATGNLYGTAGGGNGNPSGSGDTQGPATVYEIEKTASGYNSTPVVLASSANGQIIPGAVRSDSAGNLFAVAGGGANNDGVVLELSNSASGHSAPAVIATFNGTNGANPTGVIADSSDNLFGTTSSGGASNDGVIFEVANGSGAPTVLASFSAPIGSPSQLYMDASGNLFGVTSAGGANNDGTMFELAKTASGYAGAPTTITTFGGGAGGAGPGGPLVADSAGDLFGIASGATNGSGVIFEIAKTASGYASTPTILANVDSPVGPLTIDGAGNLYAPSGSGGSGAYGGGSVFELAHTAGGYASSTTFVADLVSGRPAGALTADASGNLFGTENYSFPMGGQAPGDIYEVSGSGFVPVSNSGGGGGTGGPTITQLAQFSGSNGFILSGQLISDAAGNLYGTAAAAQTGSGTVYEIAKTAGGYDSTPIVLANFGSQNPAGTLLADSSGNLYGLASGGANNDGQIFEIGKTASGFSSTPITLASFSGTDGQVPSGGLIADASGNLFGTMAYGGANNDGVVFELAKTASGYASAPTLLASFNGANGANPLSENLLSDSSGNLFGTTAGGGANSDGTVFEIAKTASGYSGTPITLASFGGANGASPVGGLIADASGDLFGTTTSGGANSDGVIFEIAKTASGYASTPTVLASFTTQGGSGNPLLIDSSGDLWGTTHQGGTGSVPGGDGTVFELAKTASGYASSLTTIADVASVGQLPQGGLMSDASGNLFGTTSGMGPQGGGPGSVYEVTGSGFVPATTSGGGTGGGTGGGGTGPTYTADNSAGQHLTATAPNATFYAGQNSVVMTEDGGNNDFIYTALPYNAGQITNFNTASDTIDVSAMLKAAGYNGTDPFGDHTLSFNSDGHGGTDLMYNPPGAGTNGHWPITVVDIDNVAASSLNTSTDFITNGSGTGGGGTGGGGTGGGGTGGGTGAGSSETLTANDTAHQQLTADKPSATFIAEHNSVIMTGDGGDNIYVFNVQPWNAGEITNFNPAMDQIDVSAILSGAHYTGSDPFGDGTLSLSSDGHGGSYLTYNPPGAGSNGVWPIRVTDIDHVTANQFQASDWIFHH